MPKNKEKSITTKERANRMSPAARRAQLVVCGVRMFARLGLGNAGHAQVAAAAGVSTPTVFLYLPNRQALIDAVLHEVDRYLVAMVDRAFLKASNAPAKLLAVTHAFAEAIDSDPDYVNVFLNWGAVVHEETWPQYIDFQDRILAKFESVIETGISDGEIPSDVNPMWAAHLVMGSANMIAQMKFRNRRPQEISAFLTALVRGVVSGGGGSQLT